MKVIEWSLVDEAVHQVMADRESWPWQLIGVGPTSEDVERLGQEVAGGPHWSFVYTVGVTEFCDLWLPASSIEGRRMGLRLTGEILNTLAAGWRRNVLGYGDNVLVPLGVPGGDDVEAVFWTGWPETNGRDGQRPRQANLSDAAAIVPILWSSPLGWPD